VIALSIRASKYHRSGRTKSIPKVHIVLNHASSLVLLLCPGLTLSAIFPLVSVSMSGAASTIASCACADADPLVATDALTAVFFS
jgi:hypothetical protein